MEKINISEAQKITSPNPFALITTLKDDGKTNIMALSWWTYLCNNPPKIGICTGDKGLTGSLIRKSGEFCLCIPETCLKEAAFACGCVSGRDEDKAEKFGIELVPSETVAPESVRDSVLVMECKLSESVSVGNHTFYIADVCSIRGDKDKSPLFAAEGYRSLSEFEAK